MNRLSLLLGALVFAAGCNSPGGGGDGGGDGGGSDVASGACTPGAHPWKATSARFTVHEIGGLPTPFVDGGCNYQNVTYTYEASTGALTEHGCDNHTTVDSSVVINAAARAELATQLEALTTTCPMNNCGADLPEVTLTVVDTSSASQAYSTDFYASCTGSQRTEPPYLSSSSLAGLVGYLHTTVASCAGQTTATGGVNRCAP